jgi:hypothetical protein
MRVGLEFKIRNAEGGSWKKERGRRARRRPKGTGLWRGKHLEFGRWERWFVFSLTRSHSSLEHTENSERIIFLSDSLRGRIRQAIAVPYGTYSFIKI